MLSCSPAQDSWGPSPAHQQLPVLLIGAGGTGPASCTHGDKAGVSRSRAGTFWEPEIGRYLPDPGRLLVVFFWFGFVVFFCICQISSGRAAPQGFGAAQKVPGVGRGSSSHGELPSSSTLQGAAINSGVQHGNWARNCGKEKAPRSAVARSVPYRKGMRPNRPHLG